MHSPVSAGPATCPTQPAVHCSGTARKVCLASGQACTISGLGSVLWCSAQKSADATLRTDKCYSKLTAGTVAYPWKKTATTPPTSLVNECLVARASLRRHRL